MKFYLYVTVMLFAACTAKAQITISTFKAVNAGNVDSCYVPTSAGLASLPLFTPVSGGSWNLTTVALQPLPVVYTYKAKTSGFPAATYVDSMAVDIGGTAAAVTYNTWRNIQQSAGSVRLMGDEIVKRQAKSLKAYTGNSLDSIVFPAQALVYTRSLPLLKFPATIGTVWLDSTMRTLNVNLTVTLASLNNAAGTQVRRIRTVDSVVGWGQIKMPIPGKMGSTWINVLQVHHYEFALDSFFMGGTPVSALLLTQLGLVQGQTATVIKTNFLRLAAVRPLLEVEHSGPTHTSSPTRVYFNAIDLTEDLSISGPGWGSVRVYPNPVRDGQIHVETPGNTGQELHYLLVNVTGQHVQQGDLKAIGGLIQLPGEMPAGIYYLTLENETQTKVVVPVELQ